MALRAGSFHAENAEKKSQRQPLRLPSHAPAFPTGNPRDCLHMLRLSPPATLAVAFTDTASILWLFQGASRRVFSRRERREKIATATLAVAFTCSGIPYRQPSRLPSHAPAFPTGNPRGCIHRYRINPLAISRRFAPGLFTQRAQRKNHAEGAEGFDFCGDTESHRQPLRLP